MPDDPKQPSRDDQAFDRRRFFRKLLLRGLDQADNAMKKVGKRFEQAMGPLNAAAGEGDTPPSAPQASGGEPAASGNDAGCGEKEPIELRTSAGTRYLRPPGAVVQSEMATLCSRCGKCVAACPAKCIKLDAEVAGGLPHIVARESPCVVCDDLSCMKACPTGALKLVESIASIRMGIAAVDHACCVRTLGEHCTLCIDPCPMGEAAIGIDAHNQVQVRPGCIGCGICERACPTEPASIWVMPWTEHPADE